MTEGQVHADCCQDLALVSLTAPMQSLNSIPVNNESVPPPSYPSSHHSHPSCLPQRERTPRGMGKVHYTHCLGGRGLLFCSQDTHPISAS